MPIEKILWVKHKSLKVAPDTDKGDDMRTLFIFLLAFITSTINAQCPDDRHPHLIDLGLPSGTMWACCNLGTNDVNGFGDYFSGDFSSENLKELLGDTYAIPTIDQLKELQDQCDYKFYTYNGVNGVLFTGKNGNTLFFPAAASYCGSEDGDYSINDEGSGAYWSQSHSNYDDYNDFMEFYYDDWDKDMTVCFGERKSVYNKLPIRAVKASNITINYCFNENLIGKPAKGFTADGASELKITYLNDAQTISDCKLKFMIDGQEINEEASGKIIEKQINNHSISVILQAPKDYYVSKGSEYEVTLELTPYYSGVEGSKTTHNYSVYRPGVLFIHGLNDTAEKCWGDMVSFLTSTDIYKKSQLLAVDYSESNNAAFDVNTNELHVVKYACEDICKQLYNDDGIASSKYDMVGHSMGGILARLYVQDDGGKESTNKIITVNTPHLGSILGNTFASASSPKLQNCDEFKKLINKFQPFGITLNENNDLKAIRDLATNSTAINHLNEDNIDMLYGIPVHAVCTYINLGYNHVVLTSRNIWLSELLLIDKLIRKENNKTETIFGDAVVSLPSQKAYLSGDYTSVFYGAFENAFHCLSPHWSLVKQEIADLLYDYKDSGFFSLKGFGTSPSNSKTYSSSSTDASTDYIDHFNEVKNGSFINCKINRTKEDNNVYKANINVSSDMSTYMIFAIASDSVIIYSEDYSEPELDLSGINEDELTFYAIGRTNYDALVMDSVTINLETSLNGITLGNPDIKPYELRVNNGVVTINTNNSNKPTTWEVYNLDATCDNSGSSKKKTICINDLSQGVKIIKISIDGKSWYEKVLITH